MIVIDAQCYHCRHLHLTGGLTCDAYPDGIPPEMFKGDVDKRTWPIDHRQPYPGDHGVRFEPLPGKRHPLEIIQGGKDAQADR